jgi:hypothetical protein
MGLSTPHPIPPRELDHCHLRHRVRANEPMLADDASVPNPPPALAASSNLWVELSPPGDFFVDDGYLLSSFQYAGSVVGSVNGLTQINVRLPELMPAGIFEVHLWHGPNPYAWAFPTIPFPPENAVTIAVKCTVKKRVKPCISV